jgi:hypothetical protein
MSKPYWSGPGTLKGSGDSGYPDGSAHRRDGGSATGVTDSYHGYYPEEDLNYADGDAGDYEDYDAYTSYDQHDTRWRWVAVCAAVVLLVAVAATAVLMYGNDSSTKSSVGSQPGWTELTPSTAPRTVIATVPPSTPSAAPLPSETVVTVTTTPAETAPPAPEPPVAAVPAPTTITYTVTGNRQLLDLITIIYTNEQGFPQTDFNVALPWTKTVVLDPGVQTKSVTATSLLGHLNCAITDASGAILSVQTNNSMIATCTP